MQVKNIAICVWGGRAPLLHTANMVKTGAFPRNKLRAWREYRRLSQEELGEKVGTTGAVISLLENSRRDLSHKWLVRLAPALHTTAGYLLDHDPNDLPSDLFDIFLRGTPEQQEQLLAVAEAIIPRKPKSATN